MTAFVLPCGAQVLPGGQHHLPLTTENLNTEFLGRVARQVELGTGRCLLLIGSDLVEASLIRSGPGIRLGFGRELDRRPIWRESFAATGHPLDAAAVANYIAKYVTKAVDIPGLPDTRISHGSEIDALRCPAHHKRMVAMAWDLGAWTLIGDPRLRLWAHQLGFGGHAITKSRRYSVTFGYIRDERVTARRLERQPDGERDPRGRPLDDTVVLVPANWNYAGTGVRST